MPPSHSVKEIFADALELAGAERSAFLDRACGGDRTLRSRIDALLRTFAAGGVEFLADSSDVARAETPVELREGPGSWIGPYKLLQRLGEGGFGVVFLAEQEEPIRRHVALKILKLGMDTRRVIARFEAERQALALMDHPNIARVLDAGATESGRPYFVMELVHGDPITHFCDASQLNTEERLGLFEQVCLAIQHAHQKGIIHRDIKPSNVLVTVADGRPIPKVIDFGIAKATNARLTEMTLFTEHGAMIGTPEYMSPEQASASGVDVDTRTDIYGLGVLLYELLTGVTPFDGRRLRSAAWDELVRILREEEPTKPSTRLSTIESLPNVAARRDTEPARLARILRGDLDWIAMKCLAKDRGRRYETAGLLALDVRRHLSGRPVVAAPPSRAYQVRKFVRRHRLGVVAGLAVVSALVLGMIGTTSGLLWALRERTAAEASAKQAGKSETLALEREAETRKVATFQASMLGQLDAETLGRRMGAELRRQVEAGLRSSFVEGSEGGVRERTEEEITASLDDLDRSLAPGNATDVARRMLAENLLAPAVAAVDQDFADQPGVEAVLRDTLGELYRDLGLYGDAERQLRRAMAVRRSLASPGSRDLAETVNDLAIVLRGKGELEASEALCREALALRLDELGTRHVDVAASLTELASLQRSRGDLSGAEAHYREALAIYRASLGDADPHVAGVLCNLATLLNQRGDPASAEPLAREALFILRQLHGESDWGVARSLHDLATVLAGRGDLRTAEPLFRESLAHLRRLRGDEHPEVGFGLNGLGLLQMQGGDFDGAEASLREALAILRDVLGVEHAETAKVQGNLATVLGEMGEIVEAESLVREAIAIQLRQLGDEHPDLVTSHLTLGSLLWRKRDFPKAEETLRTAVSLGRKFLGDAHPDLARSLNALGLTLRDEGDSASAEATYREALATARASGNPPLVACVAHHLAEILVNQARFDEAEPLAREALAIYRGAPGQNPIEHAHALWILASLLQATDRAVEGDDLLRERLGLERQRLSPSDPGLAAALAHLAKSLLTHHEYAQAEPLLRECFAIRAAAYSDGHPDAWLRFNAMSLLGGALTGIAEVHPSLTVDARLEKLHEAEALLLAGYHGMQGDPHVPQPTRDSDRKHEAVDRIVHLYEVWEKVEPDQGHHAEAAQWSAELEGRGVPVSVEPPR